MKRGKTTATPEVSVVLAVRDDAAGLDLAARSILAQENVDLELIVVDDGSEDDTAARLREIAAIDRRVRAFPGRRRGLTHSLAHGCAAARAQLLARQDAADSSLPGRLRDQLDLFDRQAATVLVSSWTECVGPGGEPLQIVAGGRRSDEPARLDLAPAANSEMVGPTWHGSTMFRRNAYVRVGGYRPAFRMAQDWDLWWRLSELGEFALVPKLLYRARLSPGSLSLAHPGLQRRFGRLAREAHEERLLGRSDAGVLARAEALSRRFETLRPNRFGLARGSYFIGSLLRKSGDERGRAYFRDAVRSNPFHLKAWLRWILG